MRSALLEKEKQTEKEERKDEGEVEDGGFTVLMFSMSMLKNPAVFVSVLFYINM